ncbi:O-antigen ligase family protein [Pseudomonas sp. GD03721]|nr:MULTISPECIES: O-antigen ligase family protein [unclassified Pseudomonas]MDH1444234.1 O-antigen ligase family protein [Pseudomonas sp. GD03722]WGG03239.1 O-antigen ligase family protein [Pseudomonas sp. GD03721]WGG07407.1 O-antigen ligase family protein [Pseudomonas sp. GD03919]
MLFVLFGISIFSASASAMKLYVGVYVHWILVLSVVAALFLMLLMKKGVSDVVQVVILAFRSSWRYFIFWILLVFSIVISSALNDWAGVYSAVKYIALAAVLLALLVFTPSSDLLLRIMMFVAVTALAAFLVVVIFLPEYMDRSVGRAGWIWMPAGVMWKAGVYLLPVLFWRLLAKDITYLTLVSFSVCVFLLAIDGSRTGAVVFALSVLLLSLIYVMRVGSYARALGILVGAILLAATARYVVLYCINYEAVVLVEHREAVVLVEHRETGDGIRLQMLKDAWHGAVGNFPWGGGFGSTVSYIESFGQPVVVHMAYLQVLSDLGVLGLIAYLGVLFYPVGVVLSRIMQTGVSAFDTLLLPVSVVSIYSFSGLLHPVSNEISEWFIVLVSIAIILKDSSHAKAS